MLFSEDSPLEASLRIDLGGFSLLSVDTAVVLVFEKEFPSWIGLKEESGSLEVWYSEEVEYGEEDAGEEFEEEEERAG